ncbi:VWA domain-containing protein [bacterium]|nr:VWA domain-containing protein [bacterium]
MKSVNASHTRLTHHLVGFGRVLRRAGLGSGTPQVIDALRALEVVGIRSREDVYQALFSVFVTRKEQIELFNQAFHLFWRAPSRLPEIMNIILPQLRSTEGPKSKTSKRVRQVLAEPGQPERYPQTVDNKGKEAVDLVLTYSPVEVLKKKDFADFTVDEVFAAKQLMQKMSWPINKRRTRRRMPKSRGATLDLRATIRRSMRSQGEIIRLSRQGRGSKPRNVVALCDVSGSMERYSRLLLHFMHALTNGMKNVETFVFGTRLTRITRHLRQSDIDVAMSRVSKEVDDWAGGTRIGEALRDFNYLWARRVLRSSGVALIISDGWDRGGISLFEREIERLARSCTRLIWLNPLLGYKDYEPLTRGIQAALPHIDSFLPVHNLESLEQIGAALTSLASNPLHVSKA